MLINTCSTKGLPFVVSLRARALPSAWRAGFGSGAFGKEFAMAWRRAPELGALAELADRVGVDAVVYHVEAVLAHAEQVTDDHGRPSRRDTPMSRARRRPCPRYRAMYGSRDAAYTRPSIGRPIFGRYSVCGCVTSSPSMISPRGTWLSLCRAARTCGTGPRPGTTESSPTHRPHRWVR